MLLKSAFHYLFFLKFSFKLVSFSKSYARKYEWLFLFWTRRRRIWHFMPRYVREFHVATRVRCVRRRLLWHGSVPCRVFRGWSDHHEKSIVRTTKDRALRWNIHGTHRLLHRRSAGRRSTLLWKESLRNTRSRRRVREHAAVSQGAQDLSWSQLWMRSR